MREYTAFAEKQKSKDREEKRKKHTFSSIMEKIGS